jgi:AraC-like DNA-binding protein
MRLSVKTIENMIEWVEKNLRNEPTLEMMSDFVGYSSYYCSSQFHEAVGITFKEYIVRRKLTLAANDLIETEYRILDIALKYGFSSNEAFSRAFSKEFGYSPSSFRKTRPHLPMYGGSMVFAVTSELMIKEQR